MKSKKNVVIDRENWIIDLQSAAVYKEVNLISREGGLLPMSGKLGYYFLYEFQGNFYFEISNKYYKLSNDVLFEITKDEFNKMKEYKTINKKDPLFKQNVSRHVISILVEDVLNKKFGINVNFPSEPSHFITRFSKKFTPEINNQIKLLTDDIIIELPLQIKMKTIKQDIRKIYKKIYYSDSSFFDELINIIYLNDKDTFDYVRKYIFSKRDLASKQYPTMPKPSLLEDLRNEKIVAMRYRDNSGFNNPYINDEKTKKM